jgi:Pyruvate/2-oxoacid:ferredoxin oxidoreductase delta subunit
MNTRKNEGTNVGKIIAITLAVVAGACAVIWFAMKLYRKYCLLECGDYDEELDEIYNDGLYDENVGCEVVVEETPAEEIVMETEEASAEA